MPCYIISAEAVNCCCVYNWSSDQHFRTCISFSVFDLSCLVLQKNDRPTQHHDRPTPTMWRNPSRLSTFQRTMQWLTTLITIYSSCLLVSTLVWQVPLEDTILQVKSHIILSLFHIAWSIDCICIGPTNHFWPCLSGSGKCHWRGDYTSSRFPPDITQQHDDG